VSELKPCPFCGGEAKTTKYKESFLLPEKIDCYMTMCRNCGCGTSFESIESKAFAAWNRRAGKQNG